MITPVMRGVVRKVTGGGRKPHVEIPDLGVGYDFGPCELASGVKVEVGDRVLVVSVGDVPEDVVVVGVLNGVADEERYATRSEYEELLARVAALESP